MRTIKACPIYKMSSKQTMDVATTFKSHVEKRNMVVKSQT